MAVSLPAQRVPLFDRLAWRDPLSGTALEPQVTARTPSGVPMSGALRIAGTNIGYPIVDCVARLTPEAAHRHREWLSPLGLQPPKEVAENDSFQSAATVRSFGFQWSWVGRVRSEADLRWRVADRWGVPIVELGGQRVLDAGAGAGDQSAFLVKHGAEVVSVDLSDAIDTVAHKLRCASSDWVGVQGDICALPFGENTFDVAYCEGVIQHTSDSAHAVRELCRVIRPNGRVLASHYVRQIPKTLGAKVKRRITSGYYEFLRDRMGRMDSYRLQLLTGVLAVLSYVPVAGAVLRRTGTVLYNELIPDLKGTWINTFDYYGSHAHQRFISPDEFWKYFENIPGVRLDLRGDGVVVARKQATPT
jgi:ubiquinone/menaquinone biosynthesis C-methylase UbiE